MDRFSISLQGYHEISQVDHRRLPCTHLIKGCAKSLDSQWDVTRTPGECPRAEFPIKLLLESEIRELVSSSLNVSLNLFCL
jgi:hypothetical protein